ncbi:MAG: SulP family inorganic anion transporter [Bacteroidia bacterium]
MPHNQSISERLKKDAPASVMVFLVALPLCLGIALASGASAFSGIISGVVGGIVIGALSGSQISVSGPAAGLTVVVLNSIESLGSFEAFLLALVIGGLLQILLGILKAGFLSNFFPSAVIRGMLAAIGLILILKQIPHALGYDFDFEGDFSFAEGQDHNTFTDIVFAVLEPNFLAIVICLVSLVLMVVWDNKIKEKLPALKIIPGALLAVVSGMIINYLAQFGSDGFVLESEHLVKLPLGITSTPISEIIVTPDFSAYNNPQVYVVAVTIALIASIETLLSIEATDKLDPHLRITPLNRELFAQGIGNTLLGLIGGIPATAVIVRSSANIVAGAVSKLSTIIHGLLLIICVLFLSEFMNKIPLASLAAILLVVGYKLTNPKLYRSMIKQGSSQYLPFIITIISIIFTDLLIGITIGLLVGIAFMIFTNFYHAVHVTQRDNLYLIRLKNNVTFLNKYTLRDQLRKLPEGADVLIDLRSASFIDHDIKETIEQFEQSAPGKGIKVDVRRTKSYINQPKEAT